MDNGNNKNSASGFSQRLFPFELLAAEGINEEELLESPLIYRTPSECLAHNTQKANPENDEKIQEMMGFLNEDDGECLFKLAS